MSVALRVAGVTVYHSRMADPELLALLAEGREPWNAKMKRRKSVPADLSEADLTEYRLVLLDLIGADLRGSNLRGVRLTRASLDRAILDEADLTGANLSGARLAGASLQNALLRSADLTEARLDGADLRGADLRDAVLDGCRLVGARLEGALIGPNLDQAVVLDSKEVWPRLGGDQVHAIRIRFDIDPERPDWPVATILIDDRDVLGLEGSIGFDPGRLLSPANPLLPTDPPRRIAVYRCSCGEAGCGCIAPIVLDAGDEIHWQDFRDFTGVYIDPDTVDSPSGGSKLGLPDLRFDSQRYQAEVARATVDRSWESHGRAVGRLLRAQLTESSNHFETLGYRVGWVGPYGGAVCSVELQEMEDGRPVGQTILTLSESDGTADDVASALAQQLLSTPKQEWPITRKNRWLR